MKTKKTKAVGDKKTALIFTLTALVSVNSSIAYANNVLDAQAGIPEQEKNSRTKFNTRFLADFNNAIDLSYFEQEDSTPPGKYRVDIVVNQQRLNTFEVVFIPLKGKVVPCFPANALKQTPVDKTKLPERWEAAECIQLAELIPGAIVNYSYDDETLYVTIPQAYLVDRPEGFIDPDRWEEGINALSINYSFNASNTRYRKDAGQSNQYSLYGSLASTLRLGHWRFHTYDVWRGGSQNREGFQHQLGYAERAIVPLLSELSVGEINTPGEIFENTSLQGVMLRSDDRMYPWTVKGYAPMIRGVANSNAVVTVKQNGNILLEKNVPPGEFKISDISALGYGGDLDVTVTESSGETQRFTVPYSSLPQLVREGYYRYSLAAGRIRTYIGQTKPLLLESTLAYGINNTVTLYGGMQTAPEKSFTAMDSGIALNTGLGAFNIGVTESLFNDNPDRRARNSLTNNAQLKMGYARRLITTNTAINLMAYAFSGKNYYSLGEALQAGYQRNRHHGAYTAENASHRLEANLSQMLPEGWGELDFSGWWESYRKDNNKKYAGSSYFLGYHNGYKNINYSFSVNRIFTASNQANTVFYLNFSMPFGSADRKRPKFHTMLSYSSEEAKLRTGVSGSHTGEDSISSFNTYFKQSSKTLSNFDINIGHTGNALQKSISYSQGMKHYTGAISLNGGTVFHPHGVSFSPWLGDTIALIEAPGAEGARLTNNRLARVDSRGYALVSTVTPYEENLMTLDLKGTSASFDINENGKVTVPTAGALVKVVFPGHVNKSVLSRIKWEDGSYLPFGMHIYDATNNIAGIVGQGGITLLSLPKEKGIFKAHGKKGSKVFSCEINAGNISEKKDDTDRIETVICYADHKEVG